MLRYVGEGLGILLWVGLAAVTYPHKVFGAFVLLAAASLAVTVKGLGSPRGGGR